MRYLARIIHWLRTAPARFEARIDEADAERFIERLDRIGNAVLCCLIALFAAWLIYNVIFHLPVPTIPKDYL